MTSRWLACVLVVSLTAAAAAAQQGTTEVRGRVLDPQGGVLPGATITARNQDTGMFRETATTPDGSYFITALTPGRYEITAELQGFKKYVLSDVRLEVGKTATVDVQLVVGGIQESVTVSADTQLVDTTSKEVGGNIPSRELVALP